MKQSPGLFLFICRDEASETVHFVEMIDKFFNALNVKKLHRWLPQFEII